MKRLFESKLVTLEFLNSILIEKKTMHEKIAFTNGCFDLLHVGHVTYLQECAKHGDFLIVGVNSDASVKRLKGPSRPINTLEDRMRVLAALESVDAIISFDQDTPLELIKALKPDVLIKGADYTIENIIGAREVMHWGGLVHTITFVEGKSASKIIEKVQTMNDAPSK
jgi:rfaE bifunctional protein nucleotidyltransferase chain/domain